MNFIPNTQVRLHRNVPLYSSETNQLWFDSLALQNTYFNNNVIQTFTEFTYQRKESEVVVVPVNVELLYTANYLSFNNANFNDKWFYAFITSLEYVNPNTTRIYYKIDSFQTWLFNLTFRTSYVEREHTYRWNGDGSPVINTIEEGLNYGSEYITTKHEQIGDSKFYVIIAMTLVISDTESYRKQSGGRMGIEQPLTYYVVPSNYTIGTHLLSGLGDWSAKVMRSSTYVNSVVSINILQELPVNESDLIFESFYEPNGITPFTVARINQVSTFKETTLTNQNKYNGFPSYSESKLYMYPYSYIELTDYRGHSTIIKTEYINTQNLVVNHLGVIGTAHKEVYYLPNYVNNIGGIKSISKALIDNSDSAVPVIDDYTAAYIQGNKNSLLLGATVDVASSVNSVAMGNPTGAISGLLSIANTMAKMKDIDNKPPSLRGQGNNSAFDFGNGFKNVTVAWKTVSSEYANTLTDFFKMFGYKVNRIKLPNLHTRQSWNYVKTIDINIDAEIPQDDLIRIKDMFNSGLTLWHNTNVGNYSLPNNEI